MCYSSANGILDQTASYVGLHEMSYDVTDRFCMKKDAATDGCETFGVEASYNYDALLSKPHQHLTTSQMLLLLLLLRRCSFSCLRRIQLRRVISCWPAVNPFALFNQHASCGIKTEIHACILTARCHWYEKFYLLILRHSMSFKITQEMGGILI